MITVMTYGVISQYLEKKDLQKKENQPIEGVKK
jgi:hypothetical protein